MLESRSTKEFRYIRGGQGK